VQTTTICDELTKKEPSHLFLSTSIKIQKYRSLLLVMKLNVSYITVVFIVLPDRFTVGITSFYQSASPLVV